MDRVAKGRRVELKAKHRLQDMGYLVDKKVRTQWHSPDFFGMFDLLGLGEDVVLVQVKSNPSDFYKARKEIRKFANEHRVEGLEYWIWLYEGRGQWREEQL